MAVDLILPRNMGLNYRTEIVNAQGATTYRFPLNPNMRTAVTILKDGETVKFRMTFDVKKKVAGDSFDPNITTPGGQFGDPLTDLDDSDIAWFEDSDDATDVFAGNNTSLTGVEISVLGAVTNDVKISVTQNLGS